MNGGGGDVGCYNHCCWACIVIENMISTERQKKLSSPLVLEVRVWKVLTRKSKNQTIILCMTGYLYSWVDWCQYSTLRWGGVSISSKSGLS